MQTETQTRREVEVDTALGAIYERIAKNQDAIASQKIELAHLLGIRPVYVTKHIREIRETAAELVAMIEAKIADGTFSGYRADDAKKAIAKRERLLAGRDELAAEAKPFNDEYEANPWSRFFLVTSSAGGHIHSSMQCSTCNWRTRYGWLPELSGLSETDAVESQGAILCTVCYPSAPVEWTGGISKVEQAEKDAREAAKVARAAEKAAKAITNPDGSTLRTGSHGYIETLVTAQRELARALQNKIGYQTDRFDDDIEVIATAIAFKTGEDKAELIEAARAKAAKKVAKEWGR